MTIKHRGFLQMLVGAPAAAALPASAFPKKLIEHVEPAPKVAAVIKGIDRELVTNITSTTSGVVFGSDNWGMAQFKESK